MSQTIAPPNTNAQNIQSHPHFSTPNICVRKSPSEKFLFKERRKIGTTVNPQKHFRGESTRENLTPKKMRPRSSMGTTRHDTVVNSRTPKCDTTSSQQHTTTTPPIHFAHSVTAHPVGPIVTSIQFNNSQFHFLSFNHCPPGFSVTTTSKPSSWVSLASDVSAVAKIFWKETTSLRSRSLPQVKAKVAEAVSWKWLRATFNPSFRSSSMRAWVSATPIQRFRLSDSNFQFFSAFFRTYSSKFAYNNTEVSTYFDACSFGSYAFSMTSSVVSKVFPKLLFFPDNLSQIRRRSSEVTLMQLCCILDIFFLSLSVLSTLCTWCRIFFIRGRRGPPDGLVPRWMLVAIFLQVDFQHSKERKWKEM